MLRFIFGLVAWAALAIGAGSCAAQGTASPSRFQDWAVGVIAADWRDGRGQPIEAFDNARRDLTTGLIAVGFRRENLVDFSLRPDVDEPVTAVEAMQAFEAATRRATAGCLLYLTSHGSPESIVFGPGGELAPAALATVLRNACGPRPTVLVVSACFSGIFVDGLAAPNRMILTAARRDRTSFGCGVEDEYTYFDGCVIQSLPQAADFIGLAGLARACVAAKEAEAGLSPPSEPQTSIGGTMQFLLPTMRFAH